MAAATPVQLPLRKDPRLRTPAASRQSSIMRTTILGEAFQAKLLWMSHVSNSWQPHEWLEEAMLAAFSEHIPSHIPSTQP